MSRFQIEISQYGYWFTDRDKGRCRFIHASPEELTELTTDMAEARLREMDREAGRPPKVYYRDKEGKIGIPPEPDMVPRDCQRFECTSLAEEDALAREMSKELYDKWQDHGQVTEIFDSMMGEFSGQEYGPREHLVKTLANGPKGRKEAEVIRYMLDDLDKEAASRQRITSNVFFHNREYDR